MWINIFQQTRFWNNLITSAPRGEKIILVTFTLCTTCKYCRQTKSATATSSWPPTGEMTTQTKTATSKPRSIFETPSSSLFLAIVFFSCTMLGVLLFVRLTKHWLRWQRQLPSRGTRRTSQTWVQLILFPHNNIKNNMLLKCFLIDFALFIWFGKFISVNKMIYPSQKEARLPLIFLILYFFCWMMSKTNILIKCNIFNMSSEIGFIYVN